VPKRGAPLRKGGVMPNKRREMNGFRKEEASWGAVPPLQVEPATRVSDSTLPREKGFQRKKKRFIKKERKARGKREKENVQPKRTREPKKTKKPEGQAQKKKNPKTVRGTENRPKSGSRGTEILERKMSKTL